MSNPVLKLENVTMQFGGGEAVAQRSHDIQVFTRLRAGRLQPRNHGCEVRDGGIHRDAGG